MDHQNVEHYPKPQIQNVVGLPTCPQHEQMMYPGTGQPVPTVKQPGEAKWKYVTSNKVISGVIIGFGGLLILCGILDLKFYCFVSAVGVPIWGGLLIMAVGLMAMFGSIKNGGSTDNCSRGLLIAVITCDASVVMLAITSGLIQSSVTLTYVLYGWGRGDMGGYFSYSTNYDCFVLNSMLLILWVGSFAMIITQIVLASTKVCCVSAGHVQVVYVPVAAPVVHLRQQTVPTSLVPDQAVPLTSSNRQPPPLYAGGYTAATPPL